MSAKSRPKAIAPRRLHDFANHSNVSADTRNGQQIKVDCDEALRSPSKDRAFLSGDQIVVKRRLY